MIKNDTKNNILNQSFALFLQKGFSDVSINDIINKVGITKGGFYHYFKTKDELVEEVIEKFIFSNMNALTSKLLSLDGNSKERLFVVFETVASQKLVMENYLKTEGFDLRSFYLLFIEGIKKYTSIHEKYLEFQKLMLELLIEILNEGIEEGLVSNKIEPMDTALFILTCIEGSVAVIMQNESIKSNQLITSNIRIIWSNIENQEMRNGN